MKIKARMGDEEKEIETGVNIKNCFDVRDNPDAADCQLPVLYTENGEDSMIGSIDKVGDVYIMNIIDMDAPVYHKVWDNIEQVKMSVSPIEGNKGYLFVLSL